eukprot:gene4235-4798_t
MSALSNRIRSVFVEAQHSMQARSKLVSMLMKIKKTDEAGDEFFKVFTEHVKYSLVVFEREPSVERTIDFIVAFVISVGKVAERNQKHPDTFSDDEEELMSPFLVKFFNFLVDHHDSHLKAVRFRACQIINKLFNALDDNISIDEDLADRIYDCMLIRLRDKFPNIRVQAVMAIYRLQDIEDENCPVVESFIHLLECDGNATVRRAVLCNIAITAKTLPVVLGRTRDVKEVVRKAAFEILSERVSVRSLSIAQRLKLLENGLNDRSNSVRKACVDKLLKAWLGDRDEKIDELLKCFHVESCPETVAITLKALFEGLSVEDLRKHVKALNSFPQAGSESRSVKISQVALNSENSIYWRHLAEHVKSLDDHALLDDILPLASEFCDYIQERYLKYPSYLRFAHKHMLVNKEDEEDETVQENEFIMQQLLQLCACLDQSDEVGRKRMQDLSRKLLISESVPYSLVENLVALFYNTEPGEDEFVKSMVEIISEIKEPMVVEEIAQNPDEIRKKKMELAKLKVELNELKESLDESVRAENFSKAAEIKEMIAKVEEKIEDIKSGEQAISRTTRAENNDAFSIYKCLHIAKELLQKVKRRELTPTLTNLVATLEYAAEYFILFLQWTIRFLQAAQIDKEIVQITAIQVIIDLISVYGFGAFKINEAQAKPLNAATDSDQNDEASDDDVSNDEQTNPREGAAIETSDIILNALISLLDGESPDIRLNVIEGFCKWFFFGQVRSVKLLTRLVLLWYNPAIEDDVKLRHCLGVFLPAFAFSSRTNQQLIEEAFLPILDTLFNAPDTSPLTEVRPLNVVELLVQLTSSRNLHKNAAITGREIDTMQELNVHDALADSIANRILSNSEDCDEVDDKVSVKLLQKFRLQLSVLEQPKSIGNKETNGKSAEDSETNNDNDGKNDDNQHDYHDGAITSPPFEIEQPACVAARDFKIVLETIDLEDEQPVTVRRKTRSVSAKTKQKQASSHPAASATRRKSHRTKRSRNEPSRSNETNKSNEGESTEPPYRRRLSAR